jgi:hypothetical protein
MSYENRAVFYKTIALNRRPIPVLSNWKMNFETLIWDVCVKNVREEIKRNVFSKTGMANEMKISINLQFYFPTRNIPEKLN